MHKNLAFASPTKRQAKDLEALVGNTDIRGATRPA
jgi:hypothetical protein